MYRSRTYLMATAIIVNARHAVDLHFVIDFHKIWKPHYHEWNKMSEFTQLYVNFDGG